MNNLVNDNTYIERSFGMETLQPTQNKDHEAEIQKVILQTPLLQEVIKHLEDEISQLKSIDSIEADLSIDPALHQKLVEVNRLAAAKLSVQKEWLIAKIRSI